MGLALGRDLFHETILILPLTNDGCVMQLGCQAALQRCSDLHASGCKMF
jgi:hypothetical protein